MSPTSAAQVYDVDDRPHPIEFDREEPPWNPVLPDGTAEDVDARIKALETEITWHRCRAEEHQAAIEVQSAMLDALVKVRRHRWPRG